jgi:outer membrane lipoprotein-sorting protein
MTARWSRPRSQLVSFSSLTAALLTGGLAHADAAKPTAAEILQMMEATNNSYADQTLQEQLTVVDVDGTRKSYDLTLYQKGNVKRMVSFTSGEIKGMSMLVEDPNSVYVYLPGFKKVRRVAASNMNQTVVGSDLSNDDMATVSWAQGYDAKLDKEDDTSWWLVLTPKDPAKSEYSKIVHRVNKAIKGQEETHYYNKAGEEVKRLVCSQPTAFGGVTRFKLAVFSDPRTGHRTELETKDAKYNQGLADDFFSVRNLQWGK